MLSFATGEPGPDPGDGLVAPGPGEETAGDVAAVFELTVPAGAAEVEVDCGAVEVAGCVLASVCAGICVDFFSSLPGGAAMLAGSPSTAGVAGCEPGMGVVDFDVVVEVDLEERALGRLLV